jgi:hypothetical protein
LVAVLFAVCPGNTAGYFLNGPMKELRPYRPKRYIDPQRGIVTPFDMQLSIAHDRFWKAEQKQEKRKNQQQQAKNAAAASTAAPPDSSPSAPQR